MRTPSRRSCRSDHRPRLPGRHTEAECPQPISKSKCAVQFKRFNLGPLVSFNAPATARYMQLSAPYRSGRRSVQPHPFLVCLCLCARHCTNACAPTLRRTSSQTPSFHFQHRSDGAAVRRAEASWTPPFSTSPCASAGAIRATSSSSPGSEAWPQLRPSHKAVQPDDARCVLVDESRALEHSPA